MKNRKGFTLVELFAVILVLGVIALIAIPQVMKVLESANKGAVETSAKHYLDAVASKVALLKLDNNQGNEIVSGTISVEDISVEVSGETPESGTITISNGVITGANLVLKGYNVTYDPVTEKCTATKETKKYVYYAGTNSTGLTKAEDGLTAPPQDKKVYLRYEVENDTLKIPEVCYNFSIGKGCIENGYSEAKAKIQKLYGFDENTWERDPDEPYWNKGSDSCWDDGDSFDCYHGKETVGVSSRMVYALYDRFQCQVDANNVGKCWNH